MRINLLEGAFRQSQVALERAHAGLRRIRLLIVRQQVLELEHVGPAQLFLNFAECRHSVDSRFAGTADRLVREPDLSRRTTAASATDGDLRHQP